MQEKSWWARLLGYARRIRFLEIRSRKRAGSKLRLENEQSKQVTPQLQVRFVAVVCYIGGMLATALLLAALSLGLDILWLLPIALIITTLGLCDLARTARARGRWSWLSKIANAGGIVMDSCEFVPWRGGGRPVFRRLHDWCTVDVAGVVLPVDIPLDQIVGLLSASPWLRYVFLRSSDATAAGEQSKQIKGKLERLFPTIEFQMLPDSGMGSGHGGRDSTPGV